MRLYASGDVLDAARTIQPLLPHLLGDDDAGIGVRLAALLAEADAGEQVDRRILSLLAAHDAPRRWLDFYLNGPRGSEATSFRSGTAYAVPPGNISAVPARKYACPEADCTVRWCCRAAGQTVPPCPIHDVRLAAIAR